MSRNKVILRSGEIRYKRLFPGNVPRRVYPSGDVSLWSLAGSNQTLQKLNWVVTRSRGQARFWYGTHGP